MSCTPQNDMNCYFNKDWIRKNQDRMPYDSFKDIQYNINNQIDQIVRTIISNPQTKADRLICDFDRSYHQRLSSKTFLRDLLNKVSLVKTVEQLADIVIILATYSIESIININIALNYQAPKIYMLAFDEIDTTIARDNLRQSLSLDNKQRESTMRIYQKYVSVIESVVRCMRKIGVDVSPAFEEDVKLFEFVVSKSLLTSEEEGDPFAVSNQLSPEDFCRTFDQGDFWKIIIQKLNKQNTPVRYSNPRYLHMLKNMLKNNDSLQMIKSYISYRIVLNFGLYLEEPEVYTKLREEPLIPQKIYVGLISSMFGKYIEDIYEQHNKISKKRYQIADEILSSMINYCKLYWAKTTLFEESTKKEAIKKLSNTKYIVGHFPSNFNVNLLPEMTTDLFHNICAISQSSSKLLMNKIGQLYDNTFDFFGIYSYVINAYCFQDLNLIYIPTVMIVSDLFVDDKHSILYNYGGLGSVVGHELMHLFDNFGSLFDYEGNLHDWWTKSDREHYDREISKIVRHYDTIQVRDFNLNTSNTIGEDIADVCGLKISLRAFLSQHKISNNDELIIFFKRWASIWKHVYDNNKLEHMIQTDPHSPHVVRINSPFSHMKEYYAVFNLQKTDQGYLPPNARCELMD